MRLFILSTILGSWLVLPPTLPTLWMDGNSKLKMAGDKLAAGSLCRAGRAGRVCFGHLEGCGNVCLFVCLFDPCFGFAIAL